MATTRLGNATYVTRGYGQVEPNHLQGQRERSFAQLPADKNIPLLENGMFVKYDYANGKVAVYDDTNSKYPDGEWLLVFNEVKTYRDYETYEDFAMKAADYEARVYSPLGENADGTYLFPADMNSDAVNSMVPRCLRTFAGDLYTTNCVMETTLAVNDVLVPTRYVVDNVTVGCYLAKVATSAETTKAALQEATPTMKWKVVKVYTLADNQKAVKLQRIL